MVLARHMRRRQGVTVVMYIGEIRHDQSNGRDKSWCHFWITDDPQFRPVDDTQRADRARPTSNGQFGLKAEYLDS